MGEHCRTCSCNELSDPTEDTVGQHHRQPRSTELNAAWANMPRSGTQRGLVLDAIAASWPHGLSDVEIAAITDLHFQSSQPRRFELMKGAWIEDSGMRRPTGKGGTGIVWRLSEKGYAAYYGAAPE